MNLRVTRPTYYTLNCTGTSYWMVLGGLALMVVNGIFFARSMEHAGHWITGMSNQVVWGVPHLFAIFLIVTASGVLNVASISSVFGKKEYQAWGRLSGLLAVTLLVGGLLVLVLDLGRPDRLIIAMTHYNFKSIFAWNIFLYTGFLLVVAVYLWMMFEPRMNRFTRASGTLAFTWRIVLTTGTGSIFGFLVARQAYDTALMAPLFIAMSLSLGTAFFMLFLCALYNRPFMGVDPQPVLARLARLTGMFALAVLFFTGLFHLTRLYGAENHGFEQFILVEGGLYTALFWAGHVIAGSLVPLYLLFYSGPCSTGRLVTASSLIIVGGFAHLYVIIIGGQAYPLEMFPGKVVSSGFFDGVVASYHPSIAEVSLGAGGLAFSILASLLAMRVLPFLPGDAVSG